MEFLLTYGWAITVLVVMISSLAYLGIINPVEWIPDKCTFGAGLSCADSAVYANAGKERVNIVLTNSFGNTISVKKVNLTDLGSGAGCNCGSNLCNIGGLWKPADNKIMNFSCDNDVRSINLKIRITYKHVDGKYDRLIEGRLQSRVLE